MKATNLLKTQHRKVEAIFKKLEGAKGDAGALVVELANNLAAHMDIEQKLFYPAVTEVDESLVLESFEEHAVAELALKRLLACEPDDPTFKAKVKTLKEMIEHHVEEEEQDLFPQVEKAFAAEDLDALGKQMKVAFEEAIERGYAAAIPRGTRTTADRAEKKVLREHVNGAAH